MIRRSVALVAMLALAGTALAQAPPSSQAPASSAQHWHGSHAWKDAAQWRQKMQQRRMERLSVLLDLTPAQR
jgi:Spy/CpxP family protein refolding chaperone